MCTHTARFYIIKENKDCFRYSEGYLRGKENWIISNYMEMINSADPILFFDSFGSWWFLWYGDWQWQWANDDAYRFSLFEDSLLWKMLNYWPEVLKLTGLFPLQPAKDDQENSRIEEFYNVCSTWTFSFNKKYEGNMWRAAHWPGCKRDRNRGQERRQGADR